MASLELAHCYFVQQGESEKRRVYHYQFLNWSEDDFPEPTHLFSMMDSIREQQNVLEIGKSRQENHPVVVHCSCGISRTGVYCCLSNITEQMKDEEQLVDVFTTVRVARSQRPLIIQTKSQYEYLYKATFELKKYLKGDSCDGENDKELPSNGLAIKAIDELDTVSTSPILEEDDSEA